MGQETDSLISPDLLRRFDVAGPRYTSYPTADRFVEAFDGETYRTWLEKRSLGGMAKALSLYVHLPFCESICYYCACNKVVTRDQARAAKYLRYVEREIALQSGFVGARDVVQMHWGGGTPTFLSDEQLEHLMSAIRRQFRLDSRGEYSIEIDPRRLRDRTLAVLRELGFNRISIGVQDFDPHVQAAVHRIQSEEQTRAAIAEARRLEFGSINIDLIYGLPRQHPAGFDRNLDKVLECAPDRIALYNYAHLPTVFKPQRRISERELPSTDT